MSELNQIIDNHTVPHHRILERSTIDRRISTDFHIIANHNRRELLDFHPTLCTGRIAKAVRTDRGIRVNRAAPAYFDRVTNHRTRFDDGIGTDARSVPDVGTCANPDPISEHHVRLNAGARINRDTLAQLRVIVHRSGIMNPARRGRMIVKNPRRVRITHIGSGAE